MNPENPLETLNNMLARISQLENELAARNVQAPPAPALSMVKVSPPEIFDGDRKKARSFLLQLKNIFRAQPGRYSTQDGRVSYAISYLRGTAFDWVIPFLESNHPMLNDFELFEDEFNLVFGDQERLKSVENQLLHLRQGTRPVATLVSEFRRLSMELGWESPVLFPLFYASLNDDVKDEISKMDRPETIEEYYNLAIRIDQRLFARRKERKPGALKFPRPTFVAQVPVPVDDPMVLGSTQVRGPLSDEEKERRRRNNLCLYCGHAGHKVVDCPVKSGKARARQ